MPVILKLTEYEAGLVVDALANGRASLMKQWGSVFEQEVYDDGVLLLSKASILENLDDNIAALAWVRKRLERAVVDTPPEGGKLDAVWHHKRGWIHPVDEIRAAAAIEARKRCQEDFVEIDEVDLVEVDAANSSDQDQIAPGSWVTLPDGYEVDTDPFETTDPEDKVAIASAGTQTDGTMVGFYSYPLTPPEKQFDIVLSVNGKTECIRGSARDVEQLFKDLISVSAH